jgi:hypothetical protein
VRTMEARGPCECSRSSFPEALLGRSLDSFLGILNYYEVVDWVARYELILHMDSKVRLLASMARVEIRSRHLV